MAGVTGAREVALVLNSGSSSLKYAAFDLTGPDAPGIIAGQADPADLKTAFGDILRVLDEAGAPTPSAVGHRIVHGGPRLLRHCLVDGDVLRELELAEPFAPLHVPAALALLRMATDRYPDAAQVACFDTAFHAGMPDIARTLPIPSRFQSEGVHRYGFHGLSCESVIDQLGYTLPERVIIAHLGNGASVTAVRNGRSIDTSMGLTPTGGVIMGTRCGDIDPGVLVHLMREHDCDVSDLEDIVDTQSGMLGISDMSSDMRRLHLEPAGSKADLAIRMFYRSVAKQIAGMMASLGGAELLVFTGGIGENDDAARRAICADLAWAGVARETNAGAFGVCRVMTLAAREEQQIARATRDILAGST